MSIGLPILFLDQFKQIPNEILSLLGLPRFSYDDSSSSYTLNKLVQGLVGLNVFQVAGIAGLSFLASIVLVSIILPNVYFKLMLLTDKLDEEKTKVEEEEAAFFRFIVQSATASERNLENLIFKDK